MITRKEEIHAILQENISLLQKLGVKKIGLFGSFARGEQTDKSDIDFIVEFKPQEKTVDHFLDLADFLEQKLERHVDLLTLESLSPYMGPEILQEAEYVAVSA